MSQLDRASEAFARVADVVDANFEQLGKALGESQNPIESGGASDGSIDEETWGILRDVMAAMSTINRARNRLRAQEEGYDLPF